jgi:SulP family sulfate permease
MTAKLVDDITDTHSDKSRESWGQGVANMASGFFGGMGGCAMIGQTMINVKASGARTRLSTFLSGVFLLVLVVALGDVVSVIPMAALVAVMIFVSIATFDWHSLRTIHRMPKSETTVMVSTVAVTLLTHNLAIGVGVGVLVACVLFAQRIAHLVDVHRVVEGETARYTVDGALFFASSNDLYTQFDYAGDPAEVIIDLSDAHVWDASTVAALDAITHKYETRGKKVEIVGLSGHSADRYDRHTGQLAGDH